MPEIDLFEHNRKAYAKVEKTLEENGKAAVIHPTGTGKSYIAFELIMRHADKKFLWFAPSEYIYNQQMESLYKNQHIKFENVCFHTYSWLIRNEDKIEELKSDYVVLDEFHRAGAKKWGKSIQKLLAAYPEARVLGLSATNIRYLDNRRDMADELFDGAVASEMSLCEAMSMEILPEPKYVISVYYYEDKLKSYERRIEKISGPKKREHSEKLLEKLRRALEQADGMGRIFARHINNVHGKIIVFCQNSEHLFDLISRVPEWFGGVDPDAHIYHVYSYNPEAEEDFDKFVKDKSEHLKVLFCIDMLNEGIHVDDVDAVVLCRPTVSPIIYKQQIGRALAAGKYKEPVIFDMVNNFDSLYSVSSLKEELIQLNHGYAEFSETEKEEFVGFEIVDELRNCRELMELIQKNLDADWNDYFVELQKYKKVHGDIRVPKRYSTENGLNLGKWIIRQRCLYNDNLLDDWKIKLFEELGMDWERVTEQRFNHWVELLKEYKAEHGDLIISNRYKTKDGEALGTFCVNIRARYRKGDLPQEHIDRLSELDFKWSSFTELWQEGYIHAKAYFDTYGDLNPPKRYVCEDQYKLGLWLCTQRNVYAGKVRGNLCFEQIEKLNKLGMSWRVEINDHFDEFLQKFIEYKNENGTAIIPSEYRTKDGWALGQWSYRMKRNYREGKLSERKKQKLNEAGFLWSNYSNIWMKQYEKAKAFYNEYGHLSVPAKYTKEHGGSLSQWLNNQRRQYILDNHGRLSEEQVKLLDEIHLELRTRNDVLWFKKYACMKKYVEEHGDTLVPSEYVTNDGTRLGRWTCRMRDEYSKGRLPLHQVKLLDEIGMNWENIESVRAVQYWEAMYLEAKKYYEGYGDLRVNVKYVTGDGLKLGQWIAQQRRIRRGTFKHSIDLNDERIGRLDALGMVWNPRVNPSANKCCQ